MGPVEALKVALKKELSSIELYRKCAVNYPTVRDTFLFLFNEENKHKKLIEKKIVEFTR